MGVHVRITRKRVAVLVVLAALVSAAVAYATIPGTGGVYSVCMLKSVGTVRLIDPSLPASNLMSHCTSLETLMTWNERGQKGDQGIQGIAGKDGAPGKDGKDGTNGTNGTVGKDGENGTSCVNADGTLAAPACRGPEGPAGPGLVGSPCSVPSGGSGVVEMSVAANGAISLTCSGSIGGGGGGTDLCPNPLPTYENAVTACDSTTGVVSVTCLAGFEDANGDLSDGCETNVTPNPNEADYCNLQFPTSVTVGSGQSTGTIYGRIFELGVTEASGSSPGVQAQLGYGPLGSDPRTSGGWTWTAATYNVQVGNNDEYMGSFVAPSVGAYSYTYRFSLDGGAHYTTCDIDGAGSNVGLTFSASNLGTLNVTP